MNSYDPCVANLVTEKGNQLTAVWHVDDVLAYCVEDFELTKFACYLAKIYGPKLTMHLGTKFDYLGMDLDFEGDGGVSVPNWSPSRRVCAWKASFARPKRTLVCCAGMKHTVKPNTWRFM